MKIKLFLCLLSLVASAHLHAQSVTATGDVLPTPSPNPTAAWNTGSDYFSVGLNATGTLTIADGGTVTSNGPSYIGRLWGSHGTVTVTGAGSLWSLGSTLTLGTGGSGHLLIENGGEVSGTNLVVGEGSLGGHVTVTGANSALNLSGNLSIGHIGGSETSTFTLADSGTVSINGGAGTLNLSTIRGPGGVLNFGSADLANPTTSGTLNAARIVIGSVDDVGDTAVINFNQTNALTLSADISQATFWFGRIIYQRGTGTTTLSGNNWNYQGDIRVSDGTLAITGMTRTRDVTVSGTSASTLRVTDGATLSGGDFYIGNDGDGTLLIDDGGKAITGVGSMGSDSNTGKVTVTGTGSQWTLNHGLLIGNGGNGTLTIADGAHITVGDYDAGAGQGTINLAENSNSTATLNFGSADLNNPTTTGTLTAANIVFGDGYGDTGAGTVNFNQTDTLTLAAAISGQGTVNQRGSGVTTLTAANTYTGETNILAGTLALRDGGSFANSSVVHVASGATLDAAGSFLTFGTAQTLTGAGLLRGEIIVEGALAVGDATGSAGLLSFSNSLTLAATSTLLLDLGGNERGVSFDAIHTIGDYAIDGTLLVSLIDGFTPEVGNTFHIFEADGTGRGEFTDVIFTSGDFVGSFDAVSGILTITGVSAIPEPSTYAAIAGALGLGFAAWRRRRRSVRAA